MMFIIGTGSVREFGPPRYRYNGNSRCNAAARAVASETASNAFAPSLDFVARAVELDQCAIDFGLIERVKTFSAGAITSLTFSTAFNTPLPP